MSNRHLDPSEPPNRSNDETGQSERPPPPSSEAGASPRRVSWRKRTPERQTGQAAIGASAPRETATRNNVVHHIKWKGSKMMEEGERSARIRELNDAFRKQLIGGRVMMTRGIEALGYDTIAELLGLLRSFCDFNAGNDPYGEHDFGAIDHGGQRVFWKIDYYDASLAQGSADPSDPTITTRVLTVMLGKEW